MWTGRTIKNPIVSARYSDLRPGQTFRIGGGGDIFHKIDNVLAWNETRDGFHKLKPDTWCELVQEQKHFWEGIEK